MKKRGISPLIATVLLIGFAIVLAALVFRWGGDFLKGQTEEGTKDIETVGPLMGVRVSLEEVKIFDDIYNRPKVLVKNDGKTSLDGFVVRIYGENEVSIQHIDQPLDAFSSKWFDIDVEGDIGAFTKVEVLPKANVNGEIVISEGSGDTKVLSTPKLFNDEHVVAYWKFDGDTVDSVGGIDCTLGGDAHFENGKFGPAFTLDGTGDYANCGNDISMDIGTGDFTIEVWAKLDSIQTDYVGLVSNDAENGDPGHKGYIFAYNNAGGYLYFWVNNGVVRTSEKSQYNLALNDSAWHHLAVVADRDLKTEFFVDGVSKGIATQLYGGSQGLDLISSNQPLLIGAWMSNNHFLNGQIDEVRISKTVRTF
ncbi:MAG: LamG-like jellyroll fold domain-containing protein [Nanoarchaeota archaeon]|nr:hypothetical protein [Nanoarchaeota archaeon]MBU1445583.1 hypothetical protein [Nanoarchaeota archaeon]MBU2406948.1 hypothetical protein [Nanoarchaeota archaeon]MBU2420403.1 hypothetical protein [Nanoarchaeota archaeon]MBU2475796.1 hypothetical protein [Nanoarchaeota archaeon]